jgi:hypothetical protein
MGKKWSFLRRVKFHFEKYKIYYQAAGVVLTIFSVVSTFIYTKKATDLSIKEYQNSLIPQWDIKINYDTNNLYAVSIDFNSLNEKIKLQKIKLIYPNNLNLKPSTYYSTHVNTHTFNVNLNKIINKYLQLGTISYLYKPKLEHYCIAIDFNYILNGQVSHSIDIFRVNFKLYSKDKFRIISLEYLNHYEEGSENIYSMLDKVNCQYGINRLECSRNKKLSELIEKYPILKPVVENLSFGSIGSIVTMQNTETNTYRETIMTAITCEPHIQEKYLKNLEIINENIDKYPDEVKGIIFKFRTFLNENPLNFRYSNSWNVIHGIDEKTKMQRISIEIKNYGNWLEEFTVDEWIFLNYSLQYELLAIYYSE